MYNIGALFRAQFIRIVPNSSIPNNAVVYPNLPVHFLAGAHLTLELLLVQVRG